MAQGGFRKNYKLKNERYSFVFFKTLIMVPFSTWKRKKLSFFIELLTHYDLFFNFWKILSDLYFFFQKLSKIFGLEFLKISNFLSHQITIIMLILVNSLCCETKVVSRVFQIYYFETTFETRWFQAVLEVFFFFQWKVSSPKIYQILVKIHLVFGLKSEPMKHVAPDHGKTLTLCSL